MGSLLYKKLLLLSEMEVRIWKNLFEEPRHIEIQIAGDQYGNACHLSERDCSVQRRNQKLTEETPSPFMTEELREKNGRSCCKSCRIYWL